MFITYVHIKALVMIRSSHVSNIKKPDVSDVKNFVICSFEEFFKVLCWLHKLWDPNHGGEIGLFSLQKGTSKLNIMG
jgi:hypothetical protein